MTDHKTDHADYPGHPGHPTYSATVRATTLVLAMFAAFAFPFSASSLTIAIPNISSEFSVAVTSITWVVAAMMLANISLSVPIGRFADLWGKRRVFNIGIVIFTVASFLCGLAPSFGVLIALRVLQGIGGAMFGTTNMAILMDVFPVQRRGFVLGLTVMCTYLGLSVGPLIGGLLTIAFSWRAIFIMTGTVALAVLVVAFISMSLLPKATEVKVSDIKINPVSTVLYMSAMLVFMYGFSSFGQHIYSYFFLGAGAVLLIIFARHELTAANPIMEMRLFKKNPNFIFSNLSALLNYAATGALTLIMTIYLVSVRGYSEHIAGLILIAQPAVMALASPLMGHLSDKRSPFIISSIGMGLCALAMLLFLTLNVGSPVILIVLNLMIVGLGFGVFSSPNTNAIMSSVTPKDFAVANSMLGTMRMVGQYSSIAVINIVLYYSIGQVAIDHASQSGLMAAFHTTFIVFALVCVAGVLLSLGRRKKPTKP